MADYIERLMRKIPSLTHGQIFWLNRVLQIFECQHDFRTIKSDIFRDEILRDFGEALRIHHAFSTEPFSKDKFEYVLHRVARMNGQDSQLAPKGNPGHDITINGTRFSLKTQANKDIKSDKIWISKFMELGKGTWTEKREELAALRDMFFEHLKGYDRILILRTLGRQPKCLYELVEIPKSLLATAKHGELEMKMESKQYPKPGYCHVRTKSNDLVFQLYFDAGSERKLQVKNLLKDRCVLHAVWQFTIPPE